MDHLKIGKLFSNRFKVRFSNDAPVDSMGCEKGGSILPPKVMMLCLPSLKHINLNANDVTRYSVVTVVIINQ